MATEVKHQMGKCLGKPKDNSAEKCLENDLPKSPKILLSYVRQESQEQAIELKKHLEFVGLKDIFLDVNEIEGGDDWAEVLNRAVLNCEVFIALVSSRYGVTKWTKREVKLADLKDKHIIPINFLDDWPPDCLAIQFACTQYIKWGPNVGKIAKDIKVHLQKNFKEFEPKLIDEDSICPCKRPRYKDDVVAEAHGAETSDMPIELPNIATGSLNISHGLSKADKEILETRPKIAFSYHNKQKAFTEFLRKELLSEYECDNWSDGCDDMSIDSQDLDSNNEMSGNYFKWEADAASIVIIILSESYCSSKTCKQQAFYCDYSKRVVPIEFEQFEKPEWLKNLFKEDNWSTPSKDLECLSYIDNDLDTFITTLKKRIQKLID